MTYVFQVTAKNNDILDKFVASFEAWNTTRGLFDGSPVYYGLTMIKEKIFQKLVEDNCLRLDRYSVASDLDENTVLKFCNLSKRTKAKLMGVYRGFEVKPPYNDYGRWFILEDDKATKELLGITGLHTSGMPVYNLNHQFMIDWDWTAQKFIVN